MLDLSISNNGVLVGVEKIDPSTILVDLMWLDRFATSVVDFPQLGLIEIPVELQNKKTTTVGINVELKLHAID